MKFLDFIKQILPIGLTDKVKNNVTNIANTAMDAISSNSGSDSAIRPTRQPLSDRRGSMSVPSNEDTSLPTTPEVSIPESETMSEDYTKYLQSMLGGFGSKLGQTLNDIFGITHSTVLNNLNNLKLWELNNAYNSPKEQMQRFKDAGLNPNLMYGQGTNGNSSSPAESSSLPAGMSAQMALNTANAGAQIGKTMAEVSEIQSQVEYNKANTKYLEIMNKSVEATTAKTQLEALGVMKSNTAQDLLNEGIRIDNAIKDVQLKGITIDNLQKEYNLSLSEAQLIETLAHAMESSAVAENVQLQTMINNYIYNNQLPKETEILEIEKGIKQNEETITGHQADLGKWPAIMGMVGEAARTGLGVYLGSKFSFGSPSKIGFVK